MPLWSKTPHVNVLVNSLLSYVTRSQLFRHFRFQLLQPPLQFPSAQLPTPCHLAVAPVTKTDRTAWRHNWHPNQPPILATYNRRIGVRKKLGKFLKMIFVNLATSSTKFIFYIFNFFNFMKPMTGNWVKTKREGAFGGRTEKVVSKNFIIS